MTNALNRIRQGEFEGGTATQEQIVTAATSAAQQTSTSATGTADNDDASDDAGMLQQIFARREFGLIAAIVAVTLPIVTINPRMISPARRNRASRGVSMTVFANGIAASAT